MWPLKACFCFLQPCICFSGKNSSYCILGIIVPFTVMSDKQIPFQAFWCSDLNWLWNKRLSYLASDSSQAVLAQCLLCFVFLWLAYAQLVKLVSFLSRSRRETWRHTWTGCCDNVREIWILVCLRRTHDRVPGFRLQIRFFKRVKVKVMIANQL